MPWDLIAFIAVCFAAMGAAQYYYRPFGLRVLASIITDRFRR